MRLKPYLTIVRNEVMSSLAYRGHFFFSLAGTIVYLVVTRFLWKAVYAGGGDIGGIGLERAYLYVGISMSLYSCMSTAADWRINRMVHSGDIFRLLAKPLAFTGQVFGSMLGMGIVNCAAVGLPALVITYALSGVGAPSAANILLFLPAVAIGFFLNFLIDFLTGLCVFATQSIRGIQNAKDTAILVLSGALVPLPFYPAGVREVLERLPFQSLYLAPARILADGSAGVSAALPFLLTQAAWAAAFFLVALAALSLGLRKLIVNGG
jgi:ABC-2 type transport system permease protein